MCVWCLLGVCVCSSVVRSATRAESARAMVAVAHVSDANTSLWFLARPCVLMGLTRSTASLARSSNSYQPRIMKSCHRNETTWVTTQRARPTTTNQQRCANNHPGLQANRNDILARITRRGVDSFWMLKSQSERPSSSCLPCVATQCWKLDMAGSCSPEGRGDTPLSYIKRKACVRCGGRTPLGHWLQLLS